MAACRPATITFCLPDCSSDWRPILRSRIFSRMAPCFRRERPGHDRHRPDRLYRDAARPVRLRVRSLAGLRNRWICLVAGTPYRTPGVTNPQDTILLTHTGWALGLGAELAIAPNWSARVEYLYNRFEPSAASFHRARVTSRPSTSRRCGLGSTESSTFRTAARRRARAAIRGRSHPTAGTSTANSRSARLSGLPRGRPAAVQLLRRSSAITERRRPRASEAMQTVA